jgi:hypothetical protein
VNRIYGYLPNVNLDATVFLGSGSFMPSMMQEDVPVIVDIEDFQYTYRCEQCGHGRSEIQKTERKYDAQGLYAD